MRLPVCFIFCPKVTGNFTELCKRHEEEKLSVESSKVLENIPSSSSLTSYVFPLQAKSAVFLLVGLLYRG